MLDRFDLVLVMSVDPGFAGQSFIAAAVIAAGADVLVAGSAVFQGDDYVATINALRACESFIFPS